jgi:PPOX class probable F420-dependent enzyme
MHFERGEALRRATAADHATLATMNRTGVADLVPVCYAIVDQHLAVPIDSVKPKGSTALGRIRNLEREPRATLLVEHWDPVDWSKLWWVRISLRRVEAPAPARAALVEALRGRYPQYRSAPFDALLSFRIEAIGGWSAAPTGGTSG